MTFHSSCIFPSEGNYWTIRGLDERKGVDLRVTLLGANPGNAPTKESCSRGAHAWFRFLETLLYRSFVWGFGCCWRWCACLVPSTLRMRCYILLLVGTPIFLDKSATYINVAYLKYSTNLTATHECNWGAACLVYLYSKLGESVFGRQISWHGDAHCLR